MARNILTSANNIFKTGSVIFTSGDDIPPPILDINPNLFGLSNGANVPTLFDSSGNNSDFTQAVSGKQGLFVTGAINGKASVKTDGVDDFYTSVIGLLPRTIFVVVKATVQSQNYGTLFQAVASSPGSSFFFLGGGDQPLQYFDTGGTNGNTFGRDATANTTNKLYVNGATLTLKAQALRQTYFTLMCLDINSTIPAPLLDKIACYTFSGSNTGFFAGEFARVLMYDERFTQSQRNTKTASLLTEYAL